MPAIVERLLSKGELYEDSNGNIKLLIPIYNYSYAHDSYSIDDNGTLMYVDSKYFLKRFNEYTGTEYEVLYVNYKKEYCFVRIATDEEKASFTAQKLVAEKEAREKQAAAEREAKEKKDAVEREKREQRILLAFKEGRLHTNLTYDKYLSVILNEKKGDILVQGFYSDSIFEKVGLKKKDVITAITVTHADGKKEVISYNDIEKIPAPATLMLNVTRGKGKKAETLTFTVNVEWNKDELKKLGL